MGTFPLTYRVTSVFFRKKSFSNGEKLKALQEKQTLLKSELTSCQTRMDELLVEHGKSNELLGNQGGLMQNIKANLEYRNSKAQLEELTREIESLEDSILQIGGFSKYQSLHLKLSQEREGLLTEVCSCLEDWSIELFVSIVELDLWKRIQLVDV